MTDVESKICGYDPCSQNFYRGDGQPLQAWRDQKYCSKLCQRRAGYARSDRAEQRRQKRAGQETRAVIALLGPILGQDWRDRAACARVDPELFYPPSFRGASLRQVAAAKAVCGGCPVRVECRRDTLGDPWGIQAGGLTPEERRRLKRRTAS